MNSRYKDNIFLIIWTILLMILLSLCFLNFKGTFSWMGDENGTANLTAYTITYYRNWPNIEDLETESENRGSRYKIRNIEDYFENPDGYKFKCWNTNFDGSGVNYKYEDIYTENANLSLYAIWEKIIYYGDISLDGNIDESDYMLLEKHVNGIELLDEEILLNADVNVDGNIDNIDIDIIKQASLGTFGYTGYLPKDPILKYDVYEGNIDVGTDEEIKDGINKDDDNDSSSEEDTLISNGEGGGSSSTGSGNGSGSSTSNSGNNSSNISNNNGGSNNLYNSVDNEEKDNNIEKISMFEFTYMYDKSIYATTTCKVYNGTCELVLPDREPSKKEYEFVGWSLVSDCLDNYINAPIYVDSSNTYYACFSKIENKEEKSNIYIWIIVISIFILSIRAIIYIISNFRKNNAIDNK